MVDYKAQEEKFREGLEELLFVSPEYGSFARAMGKPVFDVSQETAYVTYDDPRSFSESMDNSGGKKVKFAFNPDFIMGLSVEETAAVILHEAHHVILKHLEEAVDNDTFPDKQSLMIAQEAIINDTVVEVFELPLPPNCVRGEQAVGESVSQKPTKPVYDMLTQNIDDVMDQLSEALSEAMNGSGEGNSQQNSSGRGTGTGSGSESEADQNSEESAENKSASASNSSESSNVEEEQKDAGAGQDSDNDSQSTKGENSADSDTEGSAGSSSVNSGRESAVPEQLTGCSGVYVDVEDLDDFHNAVEKILDKASADEGKSKQELVEELLDSADSGGGYSPNGKPGDHLAGMSSERVNWHKLIARINPKVMSAGRKRRKVRYNWTTPNRRMRSVYPKVILPVAETVKPKKDDKGDTLPTFVIALDLSGSIPRTLVHTLHGMLEDIPKDLIDAYACTWSSDLVEYDPDVRRVCDSWGTNIGLVENYVDKIKRETNKDPYVLVITDGVFPVRHNKPGKKWFYMAVNKQSVSKCGAHVDNTEDVYLVDDFRS